ncbi:MAG TPA: (Fe-S)-binding protein [Planctomycetaceae bacterium]|nr:(Fe-S)-binding protein [Planctomycetaceae bacterium]HIQ20957.1 (Fe-S)-binding protein [Planctomycetota bacterium]
MTLKVRDISRRPGELLDPISPEELVPLPPPYDKPEDQPGWKPINPGSSERLVCNLDGVVATSLPQPKDPEEQRRYVDQFAAGLKKLLDKNNNWTFLQPLLLSLEYCVRCQTCNDACPVFTASGGKEIYRPTYRAEVLRALVGKYAKPGGKLLARLAGNDIELNWTAISRLYELCYRCTLCRRCAQTCPIGVDNGLVTRELRKLFSQELGWAPKELHEKGTVLQLRSGSSTGMNPLVVKDNVEFIDEDIGEETGLAVHTPWDKEGAEVLLIHNAGEILSWPENPGAFAIILNAAGIDWTLASDEVGYDGVNYGLFYDDVQLARIALRHVQVAKKLKVKKIVMGECGHQHKAMVTVSDRILTGQMNIPRESCLVLLERIVFSGKIKFDPSKNDFPVTLHDPCNIVRNLGIVEPQRRILRYLCPQFREMEPHGVNNYCCGGGSGFAVMSGNNFTDWRVSVASRLKFKQILDAFADQPGPEVKKYVCAPCSNCKGQLRDLFQYYGALEKSGITYGGLVELIVNAMVDVKEPFIKWEMH